MITPTRGEVWRVVLDPTAGDEMRKTRPAVVVSSDDIGRLALRIIVPFTDWKSRYWDCPWLVRVEPDAGNGLLKPSAADAFQVRSVSLVRFGERLGKLPASVLDEIAAAVAISVGYQA